MVIVLWWGGDDYDLDTTMILMKVIVTSHQHWTRGAWNRHSPLERLKTEQVWVLNENSPVITIFHYLVKYFQIAFHYFCLFREHSKYLPNLPLLMVNHLHILIDHHDKNKSANLSLRRKEILNFNILFFYSHIWLFEILGL